jgi:hypothetical protein
MHDDVDPAKTIVVIQRLECTDDALREAGA